MYTPRAFQVHDLGRLHSDIRRIPFATLVTVANGRIMATHLPVLLHEDRGKLGTLAGHVSRANAQWRESDLESEALFIFLGLNTYVSPSWYETKKVTGKVVPTWNYAAIHAYGRLAVQEDSDWLRSHVGELTSMHESAFATPWRITDAPEDYMHAQLKGIVGFEMTIERIEGKHKFNQNRSAKDRNGVICGLRAMTDPQKDCVAAWMEEIEGATSE